MASRWYLSRINCPKNSPQEVPHNVNYRGTPGQDTLPTTIPKGTLNPSSCFTLVTVASDDKTTFLYHEIMTIHIKFKSILVFLIVHSRRLLSMGRIRDVLGDLSVDTMLSESLTPLPLQRINQCN